MYILGSTKRILVDKDARMFETQEALFRNMLTASKSYILDNVTKIYFVLIFGYQVELP